MMINKDSRTGRSVVYHLTAHVVLTPKYRRKVFTPAIQKSVRTSFQELCDKHKVVLTEFNTDADHAHIIIDYPPTVCLSTFIGQLKGYSSRVLRRDHWSEVEDKLWGDSFWSPSYFVSSTGGAPLELVRQYVQDQGREPRGRGNPNLGKAAKG